MCHHVAGAGRQTVYGLHLRCPPSDFERWAVHSRVLFPGLRVRVAVGRVGGYIEAVHQGVQ
eukprot:753145-Pyramimonas_sp.AAC.1